MILWKVALYKVSILLSSYSLFYFTFYEDFFFNFLQFDYELENFQ